MREAADSYEGKPYDLYFEWSDARIYCSELVWKMYRDAMGIEIGGLQKLREFDLADPAVKAKMRERYGTNVPLDEPVISPAAMFESACWRLLPLTERTAARYHCAAMNTKHMFSQSLGVFAAMLLTALPAHAAKQSEVRAARRFRRAQVGRTAHEFHSAAERADRRRRGVDEPRGKGNQLHLHTENANGPDHGGAVEGCDFQAMLTRLQKKVEGGGFYVLSEYTIEDQGFRYGDETMA